MAITVNVWMALRVMFVQNVSLLKLELPGMCVQNVSLLCTTIMNYDRHKPTLALFPFTICTNSISQMFVDYVLFLF